MASSAFLGQSLMCSIQHQRAIYHSAVAASMTEAAQYNVWKDVQADPSLGVQWWKRGALSGDSQFEVVTLVLAVQPWPLQKPIISAMQGCL